MRYPIIKKKKRKEKLRRPREKEDRGNLRALPGI
jgi:hypothetical protein